MQLAFSTWPEVEQYLRRSRGFIVPIGSTEQHGPTGFIGTDAIVAEFIARGVGEATGAMVGPTISVGMSVHHTAFPGSLTLRPSTLIRLVTDYVLCLARYGFERFYFINGHGGNIATLNAAFWELYALLPASGLRQPGRLRFGLESWFGVTAVQALQKELFGAKEGGHATPSELSVVMYACPGELREPPALPPAPPGRAAAHGPAGFRASFPDGRIGSDPSLASPEHGRRLAEAAVKELSAAYLRFMQEE
jgi:creatinine amidohydrolase